MIDRHNRHRQDTLGIENKLVTQNWSMRVNLIVFSIIVVNTWLAYSRCKGESAMVEKQKTLYTLLAEELIDKRLDVPNVRFRLSTPRAKLNQMIFDRMGDPRAGESAHLTPTTRKKRTVNGDILAFSLQGRCRVCKCLTTFMCSVKIAWSVQQQHGFVATHFPTHLEMSQGE
jgi:hypothetical protein